MAQELAGKQGAKRVPRGARPKAKGTRKTARKAEYGRYDQQALLKIRTAPDLREALKQISDEDLKRHAKKVGADVAKAFSLKHHGLQRMNAINIITHAQLTA